LIVVPETSNPVYLKRSVSRRAVPTSGAPAAGAPDGLRLGFISLHEWYGVCGLPHNALLEGPAHATECLLSLLAPHLRQPTVWTSPPSPLELPGGECGTLVLSDVSAFGRHDQAALLEWIDGHRTQVVSTSSQPLFPLIASGLFDETLYYRLNVTLLRISPSGTFI